MLGFKTDFFLNLLDFKRDCLFLNVFDFTVASHINIILLKILLPSPRGEQGATMLTMLTLADERGMHLISKTCTQSKTIFLRK